MRGFSSGCQKLHSLDDLSQLREHVINEIYGKQNETHLPIYNFETGCLNLETLLNVYWFKKENYDNLESEVRKYLFKASTFGSVQPAVLTMMPNFFMSIFM